MPFLIWMADWCISIGHCSDNMYILLKWRDCIIRDQTVCSVSFMVVFLFKKKNKPEVLRKKNAGTSPGFLFRKILCSLSLSISF